MTAPRRRVLPGVYEDHEGALHLEVPELLAANGYAPTVENIDKVVTVATEMLGARFPGIAISVVEDVDER